LGAETILATLLAKLGADLVGAGVLPDDGIRIRSAGPAVPDDSRLALVGDADCRNVTRGGIGLVESSLDHLLCALPDLEWVMLHPTGLGKDLGVLELVYTDSFAATVKQHAARAGGPLVNSGNISRHRTRPLYSLGRRLSM
jgi:hypothetical protein